eukprot:m.43608 g.43608  ORF g.43608 m.43608 type:complete len:462 (+) comp5785_c0_seq2:66-1451(+)
MRSAVCLLLLGAGALCVAEKYVMPIIREAGFGNQYKDVVGAVALAIAWNRTFIMTPFIANKYHERRMKTSTPALAHRLEEIFDKDTLARVVRVIPLDQARKICDNQIGHTLAFAVARRNKLQSSRRTFSRKFRLRSPDSIHPIQPRVFNSTDRFGRCVGVAAGFDWVNYILSSYNAKIEKPYVQLIRHVTSHLVASSHLHELLATYTALSAGSQAEIASQRYLALHWRFDEAFCKYGVGNGLGIAPRFNRRNHGNQACFHSYFEKKPALRWIDRSAITDHLIQLCRKHNLTRIYIATDNTAPVFLEFLEKALGTYYLPPALRYAQLRAETGLLSALDRLICTRAAVFVGTVSSTWSDQVVNDRRNLGLRSQWLAGFGSLFGGPPSGLGAIPASALVCAQNQTDCACPATTNCNPPSRKGLTVCLPCDPPPPPGTEQTPPASSAGLDEQDEVDEGPVDTWVT